MEKDEKLKISAIIKTKNAEECLCNTLESIKHLDELIVIDEHSSDDTIEIAKEYKSKIKFANKAELKDTLNQTLQEAQNDWVLILEQDEIVPEILLGNIEKVIQGYKISKNSLFLPIKTLYLNKELRSARKESIRLFKKDEAEFFSNSLTSLKIKSMRYAKINSNFSDENVCILKYLNKDFAYYNTAALERVKTVAKNRHPKYINVVLAPFLCFVYWYFYKKAFLDGTRGFIFAKQKAFETFSLNVLLYEKRIKERNNDI